ncbi:MAG: type IV secretion system protein, partial [Nocardioides sp.]|uniref:type IV secretion system protein n=1 Tax=Nocardioides sp. TaxID=35761 RepID=UPI00239715B6
MTREVISELLPRLRGLRRAGALTLLTGVLVGLLSGLIGPAAALQPAAAAPTSAAAGAATSTSISTPAAPDTRLVAAAPGLKQGCPGLDALCDLGGDVLDCAGSPIDCAEDAGGAVADGAGDVKDGVVNGVEGVAGAVGGIAEGGCAILDAVCSVASGGLPGIPGIPGIPGLPDVGDIFGGGFPGLGDIPNPMAELGDIIAKAAADAWTAAMLAIWNSGLFVLRIVLTYSELFLTPDLRGDGPGKDVYGFALWLALALVVVLTVIQLGAAAFKREGKGLARALIGAGQFVVVCATWFGYCVTIVAACGALSRALMKALLNVNTWPEWEPLGGLGSEDIADATVATVLAFLGIFLWLAAIGHILVYLARAASLLVLTATGPISAAGLVSDFTRSWFWKSLRWFHAAAFTPVLMIMVLGIGVQMSNGVAAHLSDGTQKAIGTALPAVMLILVSVVAPLALFKLLAFVDPGTPSGASFRQGMAVQGGIQGLLSGGGGAGGGAGGGSSAASSADSSGRSAGEQNAEGSTGDRFNQSAQGFLGSLGAGGQAMAKGMGMISSAGTKATSLMADETNQAGVGQNTYGPDFSGTRSNNNKQNNSQSSD